MKVSAVVIAKNEEKDILACLESLRFCNEIVVIDDYSTDDTRRIARNAGARVFKRRLNGDFAAQRNYGLEKTSNKYVLFVDSDEVVSKSLAGEIERLDGESDGYMIKREDVFLGKKLMYGETGNRRLLRLARKGAGKWRRKVHEAWEVGGKVGEVEGEIIHTPCENLADFLDKINKWSSLHARANRLEGKKASLVKIVLWPSGKFVTNYFIKLGFMDGLHGFVHASMMSLHSFLAWSKLWKLQH